MNYKGIVHRTGSVVSGWLDARRGTPGDRNANHRRPFVLLLTDVPAPYRFTTFEHLASCLNDEFLVAFMYRGHPIRDWRVPEDSMRFPHVFLSGGRGPRSAFAQVAALLTLAAALLRRRPSVVVVGGYGHPAAWLALAWCKITRSRLVLWMEGNEYGSASLSGLRLRLKRAFVASSSAIASAGTATDRWAMRLSARAEAIYRSPLVSDNDSYARRASTVDSAAEKLRRGYPLKVFLYAGRLVRDKGVFELVEAFDSVARLHPDSGLVIAGDGPDRTPLERDVRARGLARVFFRGAVDYDGMPSVYAVADVLVLPTHHDCWGLVVNEAFACGVPAIVSDAAGAAEDLIRNGETGFIVRAGDARDLSEKMIAILADDELRHRMGRNCRSLIREYTPAVAARGLLSACAVELPRMEAPV